MAEGAARSAWAHTSALLALIANVNRDAKKTRAYKPSDFDPYARKVFGEQVPKVATLQSPERFALFAAVPMEIFSNLFKGFVDILDWAGRF